jgi:hypothetical protein
MIIYARKFDIRKWDVEPLLVILTRTIILFLGIIIVLRVLGKRQLGELEASEFVITLLISELASVPMQDIGTPLLHGVIPILTMVSLELLFTFGVLKSLKFRVLICGKPSLVIQQGKIIQKELSKSRISVDELLEKLGEYVPEHMRQGPDTPGQQKGAQQYYGPQAGQQAGQQRPPQPGQPGYQQPQPQPGQPGYQQPQRPGYPPQGPQQGRR